MVEKVEWTGFRMWSRVACVCCAVLFHYSAARGSLFVFLSGDAVEIVFEWHFIFNVGQLLVSFSI